MSFGGMGCLVWAVDGCFAPCKVMGWIGCFFVLGFFLYLLVRGSFPHLYYGGFPEKSRNFYLGMQTSGVDRRDVKC